MEAQHQQDAQVVEENHPLVTNALQVFAIEEGAYDKANQDMPDDTLMVRMTHAWYEKEKAIITLVGDQVIQARPARLFVLIAALALHLEGPEPVYLQDEATGTIYSGESVADFDARASKVLPSICYGLNSRLRTYEGLLSAVAQQKLLTAYASPQSGEDGIPALTLLTVSDFGLIERRAMPLPAALYLISTSDISVACDEETGTLDFVASPAIVVYSGIEASFFAALAARLPAWEPQAPEEAIAP